MRSVSSMDGTTRHDGIGTTLTTTTMTTTTNGTCICFYELGFSFFCCSLMATWYDANACVGLFAIVYWFPFRFSSRFLSSGSYLWLPLLPPSYPRTLYICRASSIRTPFFISTRCIFASKGATRERVLALHISFYTLPYLASHLLVGARDRARCIIPHISPHDLYKHRTTSSSPHFFVCTSPSPYSVSGLGPTLVSIAMQCN